MSYPLPVSKQVEDILTTASSEQLQGFQGHLLSDPRIDPEEAQAMAGLCQYELELRQSESLTRKLGRGTKQVLKDEKSIAALVVGGVLGAVCGIYFE